MNIRNVSQVTKKNVAGKQYYKCANKCGTQIRGLNEFKCPLWSKIDENKGSFDESGYEIDHIIEHCISHDDSINNLQALCKACHNAKTKQFMINKGNIMKVNNKSIKNDKIDNIEEKTIQIDKQIKCIGFLYGGDFIEGDHIYLFQCDTLDVVSYVRDTFVSYFGGNINGYYVKYENIKNNLDILESSEIEEFKCDIGCNNILKCKIEDAIKLIKTYSGENVCHPLIMMSQQKNTIANYMNFHAMCIKTLFGILLDDAIKYLGITSVNKFYVAFRKKYILNKDYIITRIKTKSIKNVKNSVYYISLDTFKKICISTKAKNGYAIRDCIISPIINT